MYLLIVEHMNKNEAILKYDSLDDATYICQEFREGEISPCYRFSVWELQSDTFKKIFQPKTPQKNPA